MPNIQTVSIRILADFVGVVDLLGVTFKSMHTKARAVETIDTPKMDKVVHFLLLRMSKS